MTPEQNEMDKEFINQLQKYRVGWSTGGHIITITDFEDGSVFIIPDKDYIKTQKEEIKGGNKRRK